MTRKVVDKFYLDCYGHLHISIEESLFPFRSMHISTFSFCRTRAATIMYKTRGQDTCYLVFGSKTTYYEEFLSHKNLNLIIGFGNYSGVDNKHIRIESFCTNVFRNETTNGNQKTHHALYIPEKTPNIFKVGNGMGNSYCNATCYKLLKRTEENNQSTKLMFLHIPKQYPFRKAIDAINVLIEEIKNSNH